MLKNMYLVICGKYRKVKKPKLSDIFGKILVLFIIRRKCKNEDEKISKDEESIKISKILGFILNYIITLKYV